MAKPGFMYLIIALIVFLSGTIYGDIPTQERAALIALYNSTNGNNWADNGGWKTPPLDTDGFAMPGTEGTWQGITVYNNHVTEINLRSNLLTGIIPTGLENLSNIKNLYLGPNQITGSIPKELGNLSNLTCLELQYNQFSSSIPPELGNLNNLQFLRIYSNHLSGSIPNELGNLNNLRQLFLYSNQLTGNIPPPFGNFDTPIDGSTVRSSIAVTGWALGDTGIESVKIYREEGKNLVYIRDGVFVEGARPDVEEAYPDYPMNYKAGWGYMMLTNFLPGGGNGIFKIHAIATDKEGNITTLGVKTIHVDNASAVKPFGAIDTPTQGGTASGSSYINWGWALTPQPNSIPTDGSTIKVWVDGVNKGHPTYNIYRSDIATLFPGYANSNGAAGTGILYGIDRRKVMVRVKILPKYIEEVLEVEKLRR